MVNGGASYCRSHPAIHMTFPSRPSLRADQTQLSFVAGCVWCWWGPGEVHGSTGQVHIPWTPSAVVRPSLTRHRPSPSVKTRAYWPVIGEYWPCVTVRMAENVICHAPRLLLELGAQFFTLVMSRWSMASA